MSTTVKAETRDGILVLTIDNPPVNALSHSVRAGLAEELAKAKSDANIKAIVLACAGRSFISGADIREFGKPPQPPGLHEILEQLENSPRPVVAAILAMRSAAVWRPRCAATSALRRRTPSSACPK